MRILLLNLTRFGDLLQSQAAVHDLTRQGHRVGVVCLEQFRQAAALLDGVAAVFPFVGTRLLRLLREAPAAPDNKTQGIALPWHSALAELTRWREALHASFSPDKVCNLTPSLAARTLGLFLAKGAPNIGFGMDEDGFGANSNAWAAFFQGASLERKLSPFHIVDMFRKIAALPETAEAPRAASSLGRGNAALASPGAESLAYADSLLTSARPQGCRGFVALQLGASDDKRRWPVAHFAALGDALWQAERLCPVILGSQDELALAERYAAACASPFVNACGRTAISQLAGLVSRMRLLVSNDTGTMHLAAGLGIPVLGFFLATAQAVDTGPYLEGCCCLEPDMDCHPCSFRHTCERDYACRRAIAPEFAAALALSRLRGGEWRAPEQAGSARIWLTLFDAYGFMDLRSLSGHEHAPRTLWLALQRHYIRQFLDRDPERPFAPVPFALPAPLPEAAAAAIGAALYQTAALLEVLAQQGLVLQSRPLPLMRERFLASWHKVAHSLRQSEWCASLELLWNQETQAEGQELPQVLERAAQFGQLLRAMRLPLG